ncbi:MAG: PhzF family phenazine biosynthesis protein [Anaerolineaceae bacterium]|nr:PhzF family phenazine biosynthesis protein [Anaerolineaceae bacterium]
MEIPIYQVDAFTNQPFRGNPAGICLLAEPKPEAWMQSVAAEMNLSETAFLLPEKDGYQLRWFTPLVEVDLCGHATLGSAHLLWEIGKAPQGSEIRFHTRSGLLSASQNKDWIELNFPFAEVRAASAPEGLIESLAIEPLFTGNDGTDYLLEVENEAIVRALQPDFNLLKNVETRCVIVTSRASSGEYDFVSRVFAPQTGVNEDPVTGSAHCALTAYWHKELKKSTFYAYQASGRGGELRLRLEGERVIISGQAVTVLHGVLLV